MITELDHLNIRTANLERMVDWYCEILGMAPGPRPPFSFDGAWLYTNERALVHLVAVAAEPGADPADLKIEHGAFRASGFAAFIRRLEKNEVRHRIARVPDFPIVQVNLWDPDGNHLHVDFDADEVPDQD